MRLNQFIARSTGLSRRKADDAIVDGRVTVNEQMAVLGMKVQPADIVTLDDKVITTSAKPPQTIILHKPVGCVCSRDGQGSKTIYDLIPKHLHHLKPVGRLDKDSSGILLLTNDGPLAHKLTHPSFHKVKIYDIVLDKTLDFFHKNLIESGVKLKDGLSRLSLVGKDKKWRVTMQEGRNRQIRRTFSAINYAVIKLHRIKFGEYELKNLAKGEYTKV